MHCATVRSYLPDEDEHVSSGLVSSTYELVILAVVSSVVAMCIVDDLVAAVVNLVASPLLHTPHKTGQKS